MHDQEGRSDQLLGRRKDVEDDRVVDGGAREMHQDDQLSRLEEGFAVLGQEELRDVVTLALPGHSPGERMARDFGVRRVGRLHRRRHGQLHRRAFDDGPLLGGFLGKPGGRGDEEPAVVGDAIAEPEIAEQVGEGVAGGDAGGVHARRLGEVDVGLCQRFVIELVAKSNLPGDQVEHLAPRGFLDGHDDRAVELLVDPGLDGGVSLGGQGRGLVVALLLLVFLEERIGFFLFGLLGRRSALPSSFRAPRSEARRANRPGSRRAWARSPRRPAAGGPSGFAGCIRRARRESCSGIGSGSSLSYAMNRSK